MNGKRAALAVIVAVVLVVAGWWVFKRARNTEGVDLLGTFAATTKKPAPDFFSLETATLNGESKQAILVQPQGGTRLTWKVTVPDSAWFSVAVGLKPDAWQKEGDGVKFLVGVSDGRHFEELFSQYVNPFGNPGDRRWIPIMVDLSTYAGEQVEIMLNTYSSLPGKQVDTQNDFALWGAPEIVIR
jgi:hypothetical protein